MHGWVMVLHRFDIFQGPKLQDGSQNCVIRIVQNFGKPYATNHRRLFYILEVSLHFETRAAQRRPESKIETKFSTFLLPVIFSQGIGEMHETEFFVPDLGPNLQYTFDRAARRSGRFDFYLLLLFICHKTHIITKYTCKNYKIGRTTRHLNCTNSCPWK